MLLRFVASVEDAAASLRFDIAQHLYLYDDQWLVTFRDRELALFNLHTKVSLSRHYVSTIATFNPWTGFVYLLYVDAVHCVDDERRLVVPPLMNYNHVHSVIDASGWMINRYWITSPYPTELPRNIQAYAVSSTSTGFVFVAQNINWLTLYAFTHDGQLQKKFSVLTTPKWRLVGVTDNMILYVKNKTMWAVDESFRKRWIVDVDDSAKIRYFASGLLLINNELYRVDPRRELRWLWIMACAMRD
jgi:hypothetical protein